MLRCVSKYRHGWTFFTTTILTTQATVLLLFNESEQLTFSEIQAALKLEDSELRRTLASLSLAKEK